MFLGAGIVSGSPLPAHATVGSSWPSLAGNPGPPPSPASVILSVGSLVLVFAAFAGAAWSRRRRQAPLRKQMRARPAVTFRAPVQVKQNVLGVMLTAHGTLDLLVRGDAIEVSHPFPPARLLFGQEYRYRAADITFQVIPGIRGDWIAIDGQRASAGARIWLRQRGRNQQLWDALTLAGAHPVGPAPRP
jgi:hypothetical protein